MKKNVILLSFIILACIFAILYHSYFFLPNKIDCINILINETEKEVNTLEYDSFIKIITKGKKNASIDLDDFKSFIINYNLKNGEKINYKIYFNFNNNTINYYKNTTMYTLSTDLSKFFFLHEDFDFIYTKTVPKFNLYFCSFFFLIPLIYALDKKIVSNAFLLFFNFSFWYFSL